MTTIKTLLADYFHMIFFKLLLAIASYIFIAVTVICTISFLLYLKDYSPLFIVTCALTIWLIFLSVIAILFLFKLKKYNENKKDLVNFANKEAWSIITLQSINSLFRKFRRASKS